MTRIVGILVLATSALACTESSPCPAGQQITSGYCVAAPGAGPDGGQGDLDAAASADGALDSASETASATPDFGTPCASQAECGGVASYCAVQPGMPGYCTAPGCDTAPEVCPAGWTCFNVGIFKPGEPYICLRP